MSRSTQNTLGIIGLTFALILFTVCLGFMAMIVVHGPFDMLATVNASVPLLAGPTLSLSEHSSTVTRKFHVTGKTLNDNLRDREIWIKVNELGRNEHVRIYSKFFAANATYKAVIFYDPKFNEFSYSVKEQV